MYNLIFIDDEAKLLDGLIPRIDWDELGFNMSAKFNNTRDALDFISHTRIDLVIMDVKLSDMMGVEFVKILSDRYPNILVVFLSAFSKFEYAQEALRCDAVVDYLLKPISINKLSEVIRKVKCRLDKQQLILGSYEENIIAGYLLGSVSKDSFTKYMLGSEFNIYDVPIALVSVEIKNYADYINNIWKYGKEKLYTAIGNQFYAMQLKFILYQVLPEKLMYALYLDRDVFP